MIERQFPPVDRDALGQAEQILNQAALYEGVAFEAQYPTDIGATDPDALVLRSMKHVVDASLDRNDTPAGPPLEQAKDAIQAARVAMAIEAFLNFTTQNRGPIPLHMTEGDEVLKSTVDEIKTQMPPASHDRFRNVAKLRKAQTNDNLQRHKNISKLPKKSDMNLKNNPYRNK